MERAGWSKDQLVLPSPGSLPMPSSISLRNFPIWDTVCSVGLQEKLFTCKWRHVRKTARQGIKQ